jgi:hypothetical protein
MRPIIITAAAAILLGSLPAKAAYLGYADWTSLPAAERAGYIAGAFDQFTTIVAITGDRAIAELANRYQGCLGRMRMTHVQLAENVRMFGDTKPDLQMLPVPVALMQYLALTCGSP